MNVLFNETCFCFISTHEQVDNVGLSDAVFTVSQLKVLKKKGHSDFIKNVKKMRYAIL